ncbi:MAG: threonylcarbamoyl-AMP synthase [Candidatus Yanofskybacteria bacterium]|nr:threonylcarbamoyl-AMP synthase [Candidatus Yanofskybacteria bacterium]
MKVISINLIGDYSAAIGEAISVLKRGGVIVYPTDTVYGLGTNACDEWAVEQVFKIKKRPRTKPLPILARNMNWVKELAFVMPKLEERLGSIWPSQTTVILPKKDVIPGVVTAGYKTVGIRISGHPFVDKLLGKFGYPITATSANISGEEPTGDIKKIVESFSDNIWKPDLIINAGVLPPSQPSTILDMSKMKPKILRVGPSKPEQLLKLLGM